MCLIVFSWNNHPEYKLIVAANRDEHYKRPTRSLHYWPHGDILAGMDLTGGGTWLGINKMSKFTAVTNYRDLNHFKGDAKSRGKLTLQYLQDRQLPEEYLVKLTNESEQYNGFNLLVGDFNSLFYFSNISQKIEKLAAGLYGLSNHLLNTPWPKVSLAKDLLTMELKMKKIDQERLFDILHDKTIAPDDQLPTTGVGLELERALSPLFIQHGNYGTRCSSVLLMDYEGNVIFRERSYTNGAYNGEDLEFKLTVEKST